MEQKNYWDKEEFEDIVARALISLYEEKIASGARKGFKAHRLTEEDLQRARNIGCYFAPADRLTWIDSVDMVNDGLPDQAVCSHTGEGVYPEDWEKPFSGYVSLWHVRKIDRLPPGIQRIGPGTPYAVVKLEPMLEGKVDGIKGYCTIDTQGQLYGVTRPVQIFDSLTRRMIRKNITYEGEQTGMDHYSNLAAMTIGLWQDRRYLWNVQAIEGRAKVTMGVYPEQIQSLFYARTLPATETGRKRPILHWVSAHRRRMQAGTEIDVDQYLRGVTEFEMGGTQFRIINPAKKPRRKTHGD